MNAAAAAAASSILSSSSSTSSSSSSSSSTLKLPSSFYLEAITALTTRSHDQTLLLPSLCLLLLSPLWTLEYCFSQPFGLWGVVFPDHVGIRMAPRAVNRGCATSHSPRQRKRRRKRGMPHPLFLLLFPCLFFSFFRGCYRGIAILGETHNATSSKLGLYLKGESSCEICHAKRLFNRGADVLGDVEQGF